MKTIWNKTILPSVTVTEMVDAYRRGWSLDDIAGDFGIPASTARRVLMDEGVKMRSRADGWELKRVAKTQPRKIWKDEAAPMAQ